MFKIGNWIHSPPSREQLLPGSVHLWNISLSRWNPVQAGWLSADERARAKRFRREFDRTGFIAARASLRGILAIYLDRPPEEIEFSYNDHGKPGVGEKGANIEFNLSHAGDRALLAVSWSLPLGVDLERVSNRANASAISRRVFGTEFARALENMSADDRSRRFLEAWTALEARTKALGTGVFAKSGSWERFFVVHFEPMVGWLAALSSPLPIPPIEQWGCFEWPVDRPLRNAGHR